MLGAEEVLIDNTNIEMDVMVIISEPLILKLTSILHLLQRLVILFRYI
jgi:hypothetical protein